METRRLFKLVFAGQAALALCVGGLSLLLYRQLGLLNASRDMELRSYLLADELQESSEDLTRMARTFVATGDPEFERRYHAVLDIRDGKLPRPDHYDPVYWQLASPAIPDSNGPGERVSLHDLMMRAGFTRVELDELEQANGQSDALVKTEIAAMNAAKGWFDDGTGNFTVRGSPDRDLALRMTHDRAYRDAKSAIMRPIEDFYRMFRARTAGSVAAHRARAQKLVSWVVALALATLASFTISLVALLRQVARREALQASGARSEARSRELEAMLQAAFSMNPAPITIADMEHGGRIVEVNEAFERVTGYPRDEVLGANAGSLELYAQPEVRAEVLRRLEGEGYVRDFEHSVRRKDGSLRTLLLNLQSFASGDARYVMAVSIDVTEKKKTELELRERLEFESLLADLAGRFLDVTDDQLADAIRYAQERICARFGLDRSSVMQPTDDDPGRLVTSHLFPGEAGVARIGSVLWDFFPWSLSQLRASGTSLYIPDMSALPHEAAFDLQNYQRIGLTSILGVPWFSADGSTLNGLITFASKRTHPLSMAGVRRVETLARMILVVLGRARERRAKALGQERMRVLGEMLDAAPTGIMVLDREGKILYANPHVSAMHGYSAEEFATMTLLQLCAPESRTESIARIESVVEHGEQSFVVWHLRKDGTPFHAHVRARRTQWGDRVASLSVQTDLTEREQAEAELDRYRQHLEDLVQQRTEELRNARDTADHANQAKSRFLANMSHEIRTPMNAVLGFAQLLLRDPAVTEQQRRHLETISRAGDHLMALIDGILQLAKVEAGHEALAEAAFDLWMLVDDIEQLFQSRAVAKGLQLVVERSSSVPRFLRSDEGKLRQVLSNLLGNAIKFTDEGRVVLRLDVRGYAAKRRLRIEVEDTGHGIDPAETSRLFQKFEQTEAGRASKQGTGLGLAISRELIQLMSGDIGVESEPGRGSRFHVEIPCVEASAVDVPQGLARRAIRIAPGRQAFRVLVADDLEDNRTLLGGLLKVVGFEIRQCTNGLEAIREFESWRPHAILMDVRMPELDGIEAVRRIRSTTGGGAVKIICVTASVYDDDVREAKEAGADDFMKKPIRENVLLDRLEHLLGVRYEDAPVAEAPAEAPTPATLARLPERLRNELKQATLSADLDEMLALLDEAKAYDARLAASLRELAERFAYERIMDLLERPAPSGEERTT